VDHELAQMNLAQPRAPLDSPVMAEFMANLDRINALAEASPGFVWRLQTDAGNATALRPMGPDALVNMSVWRDAGSLGEFVLKSGHVEFLKRRREWFERIAEAYVVLWWVPRGHRPTVEEGVARLMALRANGPTPHAFTFRHAFAAPSAAPPGQPG
jgi:hypothetical protein